MRKLRMLVATLMMTLIMASPAYAINQVANIGGTVNINSFNTTTDEETTTVEGDARFF